MSNLLFSSLSIVFKCPTPVSADSYVDSGPASIFCCKSLFESISRGRIVKAFESDSVSVDLAPTYPLRVGLSIMYLLRTDFSFFLSDDRSGFANRSEESSALRV